MTTRVGGVGARVETVSFCLPSTGLGGCLQACLASLPGGQQGLSRGRLWGLHMLPAPAPTWHPPAEPAQDQAPEMFLLPVERMCLSKFMALAA